MLWLICFSLISLAACDTTSLKPCNLEDSECLTQISRFVYKNIIQGVPDLGIPSSDPIFHEEIKADLPTIKFVLTKTTVTGFKDCEIKDVKLTKAEKSTVHFNIHCPHLVVKGQYDGDGELAGLPLQGKGDFETQYKDYLLHVDGEMKPIIKDDKKYISIEDVKVTSELLGALQLNLENLFNGDQEKAAPVNKFIQEHQRETVQALDGPVVNANVKVLFKNFNKQLAAVPIGNFVAL